MRCLWHIRFARTRTQARVARVPTMSNCSTRSLFVSSTQTTCDSAGDALFVWAQWTISNISFRAFLNWRLRTETASSIRDRPNFMSWKSRTGFAVLLRPKPQLSAYLGKWLATETDHARLNPCRLQGHTDFAKPDRRPSD
jgi:hypothetical protein